jgi:hypothetical protein
MIRWIRNFFQRHFQKTDEDIESVLQNDRENWPTEWKDLTVGQPKDTNVYTYLEKNPEKEKLFLKRLEAEFQKESQKKPVHRGTRIFVPVFASVFLVAFVWISFYISKKETRVFNEELQVRLEDVKSANIIRGGVVYPLEQNFLLQKGDILELTDVHSMTSFSSGKSKLKLQNKARILFKDLPEASGERLTLSIQFGNINLESSLGRKPELSWETERFVYTPTGTVAELRVKKNYEVLFVQEGSFSRENVKTGEIKQVKAGDRLEYQVKEPSISSKNYTLPGTIHLKNGKIFTGFYSQGGGIITIETVKGVFKFKEDEVLSIE